MTDNFAFTSYSNLESYVKGGGKVALLVSRDLARVTGSCVRLAKKSGRTLYRWDGAVVEKYNSMVIGTQEVRWEQIGSEQDFSKLFPKFAGIQEAQTNGGGLSLGEEPPVGSDRGGFEFDENSILWLPLRQPFLVQDGVGGSGNRSGPLLRENMAICNWALNDEQGGHSADELWQGKTLLIGGLSGTLPEELKSVSHVIRWDYPSRSDLRDLIFGQVGKYVSQEFQCELIRSKGCGSILDKIGKQAMFETGILQELATTDFKGNQENFIQKMVEAAQGLDIEDCRVATLSSFREALEASEPLMSQGVINRVMARKVELLSSEGLLSVERSYDYEEVGGYSRVADDIKRLKERFLSPVGESHGIKRPKGYILTGVPGCGKSLTAKTIAKILDVPLLGFDLGKITTSFYGESEENMHKALNMATGMAPCVLWIDEFEKMFSSAGSGQGSHEVSQRMNAIFLKWMEERTNSVFVVATSNDLSGIKAEYQRSGRWDGTYFFDLPSNHERIEIISNVFKNTKQKKFDVLFSEEDIINLSTDTVGWAGSDIVSLITEGKNLSFTRWLKNKNTPEPVLTISDIREVQSSDKIVPMMAKDSARLARIRIEGGAYTSASNYEEDDTPVPEPKVGEPGQQAMMNELMEFFKFISNQSQLR